jgi:hypothetical protein
MIRIEHATRILINSVIMLLAFCLLALSLIHMDKLDGFYCCIVSCVFIGFTQAFGEATIMGYLKGLPSDLVMTWGSGTGLSGFTDVFTVLFLSALGISHGKVIFFF